MGSDDGILPKFEQPPVTEAVFGVEFATLRGWELPHFGLFWEGIRDEYPTVTSAPALPPPMPDGIRPGRMMVIAGQAKSDARCLFHHRSGSRLLQLQHDRFVQNWRESDAHGSYSGYETIRPVFAKEWVDFLSFLERAAIQAPAISHCEVTYINTLQKGIGWNTLADLEHVVRCWKSADARRYLPVPDAVAMNVRYPMGADGQLTIQLQPAIRLSDGGEILQLTLTARGRPATSSIKEVMAWMDSGHEWIVRGFEDFTTESMHKIWGKKEKTDDRTTRVF